MLCGPTRQGPVSSTGLYTMHVGVFGLEGLSKPLLNSRVTGDTIVLQLCCLLSLRPRMCCNSMLHRFMWPKSLTFMRGINMVGSRHGVVKPDQSSGALCCMALSDLLA